MSNPYKATLYNLDSEVEIEGLSMFSKITDTELYFIFYILYFIFYILYSNSDKVLELEKEGVNNYPPRKLTLRLNIYPPKKINSTIVITHPQTHLIR
jgi:hypothetical protein